MFCDEKETLSYLPVVQGLINFTHGIKLLYSETIALHHLWDTTFENQSCCFKLTFRIKRILHVFAVRSCVPALFTATTILKYNFGLQVGVH